MFMMHTFENIEKLWRQS